jgi:TetR/AcrR family hemagglutinin/protease transcriptional regulator
LACAVRVFARRGIGAARHAEVAAEAGVAVPTAFAYFPSREELVRSVLQEVDRFLSEMIESAVGEGGSASETLLRITRAFAEAVETHPDTVKVWLGWSTAIQDEIWPLYEDFQRRVISAFVAVVREGQARGELDAELDAETAAYLVVGSAHMIAQMRFTKRDPEGLQRYLETVIHGALHQR